MNFVEMNHVSSVRDYFYNIEAGIFFFFFFFFFVKC